MDGGAVVVEVDDDAACAKKSFHARAAADRSGRSVVASGAEVGESTEGCNQTGCDARPLFFGSLGARLSRLQYLRGAGARVGGDNGSMYRGLFICLDRSKRKEGGTTVPSFSNLSARTVLVDGLDVVVVVVEDVVVLVVVVGLTAGRIVVEERATFGVVRGTEKSVTVVVFGRSVVFG